VDDATFWIVVLLLFSPLIGKSMRLVGTLIRLATGIGEASYNVTAALLLPLVQIADWLYQASGSLRRGRVQRPLRDGGSVR